LTISVALTPLQTIWILHDWSVSVVTGLELIAGAKDKREVAEIDLVLGAYHVIPTNPEIGQKH
jgi:hypothetical protein